MAIAIIDYGAGNLLSIARALTRVGGDVFIATAEEEVARADAVVLPGVGAAGSAMRVLEDSGIAAQLRQRVPMGLPILGICLGMQLFFADLEEGDCAGLGFIPGRVTRLEQHPGCKIPHMGWNTVTWDETRPPTLFAGLPSGFYAYFVHSYRCLADANAAIIPAWTDYGEQLLSAVEAPPPTPLPILTNGEGEPARSPLSIRQDGEGLGVGPAWNVWGMQFHPEKSGEDGLAILRNFVGLVKGGSSERAEGTQAEGARAGEARAEEARAEEAWVIKIAPEGPAGHETRLRGLDSSSQVDEWGETNSEPSPGESVAGTQTSVYGETGAGQDHAPTQPTIPNTGRPAPAGLVAGGPSGANLFARPLARTSAGPQRPFTVYPAIDLLGGKCVRLLHGEYDKVTTYDGDPLEAARRWCDQGAEWLHVVDLDGARQGKPAHLELVARIVREVGLPVRLGGGLRTADDVAAAFAAGVHRVALGTAALDADLLRDLVDHWGEGIEIALDRRGDAVAVAGWQTTVQLTAREWARRAVEAGVRAFLVTDIRRDGALSGANVDLVAQTRDDAGEPDIEITIAGGVTSAEDIRRLARAGANGAVIGRALYDGRIALPDALAAAQEAVC